MDVSTEGRSSDSVRLTSPGATWTSGAHRARGTRRGQAAPVRRVAEVGRRRRSAMPCSRASDADAVADRLEDVLGRRTRGRRTAARSFGRSSRPVARQVLEEVLAGAGPEVEHVRPDRGRAGVAGRPHDVGHLRRIVGQAGQDRRHARRSRRCRRRRASGAPAGAGVGGAVPGSVSRQISRSRVGIENVTPTSARSPANGQDIDIAHDHRAAGDEADRRARLAERLDRAARQPEPALRRLVRVRRRADRRPARAATTFGRVRARSTSTRLRLDPDRGAIAGVGRPVGQSLERADEAERATVGAAHVRVERPLERHVRGPASAPTGRVRRDTRGACAMIEQMCYICPSRCAIRIIGPVRIIAEPIRQDRRRPNQLGAFSRRRPDAVRRGCRRLPRRGTTRSRRTSSTALAPARAHPADPGRHPRLHRQSGLRREGVADGVLAGSRRHRHAGSLARPPTDWASLRAIVADPATDLFATIPNTPGHTILREVRIVGEHNAYHVGEFASSARSWARGRRVGRASVERGGSRVARIGDPRDHRLDAWPGPEPLHRPAHACRRPRRAPPCGPVGRARHGRRRAVPLDRRDRPLSIGRVHDPEDVAVVHGRRRPDHPQHRRPRDRPLDGRPSSATSTTCAPTTGTRSRCPTGSIRPAGRPGFDDYVDSRYRLYPSGSFDSALRSAVTNLRKTNLPVGITVVARQPRLGPDRLHRHRRSGRTTTRFTVTSVRVVGPLWGLQSRTLRLRHAARHEAHAAPAEGLLHAVALRPASGWPGRAMGLRPAGGIDRGEGAGPETQGGRDFQADAAADRPTGAGPDAHGDAHPVAEPARIDGDAGRISGGRPARVRGRTDGER